MAFIFDGIENEEIVDLGYKKITSLSDMPISLPKNKELHLNYNQIASLEGMPKELPINVYLQLDNNNIATLHGMPELPQNAILNLSHNQITSLHGMPKLPQNSELYLNNNQLTSLEGFSDAPKLRRLRIHDNQLKSLHGLPRKNYHAVETISTDNLSQKGAILVHRCFANLDRVACNNLYQYYEKPVHDIITKQTKWTDDEVERICHEFVPEDILKIHHNDLLRSDPRIQKCAVVPFPLKSEYSIVL